MKSCAKRFLGKSKMKETSRELIIMPAEISCMAAIDLRLPRQNRKSLGKIIQIVFETPSQFIAVYPRRPKASRFIPFLTGLGLV